MIKKIVSTSVVIGTMFMVIGCGAVDDLVEKYTDEDDDIVYTGKSYYIDSAVSGVNYTCGSQEGITGADGSFIFEYGLGCTFYLGDIELRGVDSDLLFDGNNVYETDINIARILQSLDLDGDASNGITIDAATVQALADAGIASLPTTEAEMDEMLQVIEDNGGTYVSEEDAQAHLDETKLTLLLAGNTLYTTIYNQMGTLESFTFSADLTSATWVELVGGSESETGTLVVDGMTMVFTDSDGSTTIVVTEILADYILISVNGEDAQRLYFNEAAARAYFISSTPNDTLETLLSGNTLYTTIYNQMGTLESFTFSEDLTSATWVELVGGSESETGTLVVDGMTMVFTDSDGSATIVVTEILADYILMSVNGDDVQRLYFDEAKARAYFLESV